MADSRVTSLALDVTNSAAVDALVDQVESSIGPIMLAASVAGVLRGRVAETGDADWRRVFAVNADGVFHVGRALARVMSPRRRARSLPSARMQPACRGTAWPPMHQGRRHHVHRCLGLELAPLGIRCNIVAPGSTLTPMQTGMWQDEHGAERVIAGSLETYKAGIPLRKLATPEDIAHSVMFLLSEQAGHVAMSDLYVDGGATLRG